MKPPGTPQPASPQRYDFSAGHIKDSCEQSLRRLGAETIDLLMLHRPDYLADPQEIARAFADLKAAGKVRYFGISNFRPSLVTALQVACPMPLIAHQVEISLAKLDALNDGTLDQCLTELVHHADVNAGLEPAAEIHREFVRFAMGAGGENPRAGAQSSHRLTRC